jgi:flavin reductase (DIM6/NTAB) family NADH-FMN oxidoreductase RutF
MTISGDDFKRGMASWPSGVTIVTTCVDEAIHGMTVSDFAGVSVDPPLVLVCASKDSSTLDWIQRGHCFAINILAEGQESLSNRFASKQNEDQRFEGLETETAKTGAPLLAGTVAGLDCSLLAEHDAGDHVVVVGRVEHLVVRELRPLLYFRGAYQRLAGDA